MNTHLDLGSVIKLIGGCLFCVALAALGFYPFADHRHRRDTVLRAYARRGVKSLIH